MATRIFLKKLAFLSRILENPDSISHRTYISLTQSTTERSIKLIEGCSFLEAHLLLEGFVARVKDGSSSIRELKKELLNIDSINLLEECKIHHSTYLAAKIATSTSWLKIWDLALDLGPRGTLAIQLLFKTMTRPVFGSAACSLCQQSISTTFFDHIITHHIPARPSDPHLNEEDIGRNSRHHLCHKTFPTQSNVHTQLSATIIIIIYTYFCFCFIMYSYSVVLLLCIFVALGLMQYILID